MVGYGYQITEVTAMADMFDYLSWRGDIPFSAMGPNPVDSLILSTLIYIDFGSVNLSPHSF